MGGQGNLRLRILLDTHALIWWLVDNSRQLSSVARIAISDEENEILISAITAFEITTKHRPGRLAAVTSFVDNLGGAIANEGFVQLPISFADAASAGALTGPHQDPFDRMLIAQVLNHNLTLVSNETLFDSYGIQRLW